ncbi:hypothetical protein [Streptomyces sp. NPDC093591]
MTVSRTPGIWAMSSQMPRTRSSGADLATGGRASVPADMTLFGR